jgi:3-hydroxybutyryl-CoA dehydratase
MSTNGGLAPSSDGLELGSTFTTRGRTITEADLVSFSCLTGDWHPQHSDAAWAAGSRFGQRVAHGMLVLSYVVGLLPLDPERVVALRGFEGVTFKRPVYVGQTIHAEGRLEELRPVDPDVAMLRIAIGVVNDAGETVARAKVLVLWRQAEASAAPAPAERELDRVLL